MEHFHHPPARKQLPQPKSPLQRCLFRSPGTNVLQNPVVGSLALILLSLSAVSDQTFLLYERFSSLGFQNIVFSLPPTLDDLAQSPFWIFFIPALKTYITPQGCQALFSLECQDFIYDQHSNDSQIFISSLDYLPKFQTHF